MQKPAAPALSHLFSYTAQLRPPEVIGPVPEGIRANFYVTGGTLLGPRLYGVVLTNGGDWLTLRPDGMAILDVRATLKTEDEALIYMSYPGMGDLGADGYQRFVQGDLPRVLPLTTAPAFRTAAPQYQWLHRLMCIGTGEVDFERSEVRYDVFSIG